MAPKYAMVTTAVFQLLAKEAQLYTLEVSKLYGNDEALEQQILMEYEDLCRVFSEEASNELPDHSPSDIKIEFKEGEEP